MSAPRQRTSRGPARGPARGISGAPARGPDRGPTRGPDRGPARGPDRGPARGPDRGPARGPDRGPARGPDRGPDRGPSRGGSSWSADRGPRWGPGPARTPARATPVAEEVPKKSARPRPKHAPAEKTVEAKAAAEKARVLSGKQARHLRGLGHQIEPTVQIGKDGLTDGVVAATREALLAHELVKVKILQDAPIDRKVAGSELAGRTDAALAQTLGRTLLLYKRHPSNPKIVLPR